MIRPLLLILVGLASCAIAKGESRNILLICVDDLRPELGCFGVEHAQSPHLDRFARDSIRFTNHFVQVPTCGASRYALLTGRSPARSGVTASNTALYQGASALPQGESEHARSMPELFRLHGYRTICIGKVSHTADGRVYEYNGQGDGHLELPGAWDELPTPFGPWERGWGIFFAYANGRHREDGQGHRDVMEFVAEEDDALPDGLLASTAIEQLQDLASRDQPFFLAVGFFKPHLPFVATREDWEAFENVEIPLPDYLGRPESPYWHGSGEFFKYDFPFEASKPLPDDHLLACRRAYLACVRYTDRQIGRVLDGLDAAGLSDDTIVVVWGDHGWNLGDAQLWGKHTLFERAVRSPLMIRVPGMENAGASCDAMVESLDILPTLVELVGINLLGTEPAIAMEHRADGISLTPLMADPTASIRTAAVSYWQRTVSARDADFRLIATRGEQGWQSLELYTAANNFDPVENVAEQHPDVVQRLLLEIESGQE